MFKRRTNVAVLITIMFLSLTSVQSVWFRTESKYLFYSFICTRDRNEWNNWAIDDDKGHTGVDHRSLKWSCFLGGCDDVEACWLQSWSFHKTFWQQKTGPPILYKQANKLKTKLYILGHVKVENSAYFSPYDCPFMNISLFIFQFLFLFFVLFLCRQR